MNWMSKGFIYALTHVSWDLLESRGMLSRSSPKSDCSNKGLYSEVSTLCQTDGAVQRLMDLLKPIEFPFACGQLMPDNLNNLLATLEDEKVEGSTQSAYNEMSCIQFHCLLIALLIGYVKALQEYDGLYKLEGQILQGKGDIKREELTPKMRDSQRLIWMYGRFIWTITTSGMFDAHLQAMTTALIGIRSANETAYTVFSISLGLEVAHSGEWE